MSIAELAKFLEKNSGKDKVMRTLCYSTKFAAGVVSSPTTAKKLDKFSNQMSECRALLRLFDDIPMLQCTLSYGIGRQEKDRIIRCIDLLSNIIDQAYFPIEHIAWFIENDYLNLKNNPWSTTSTVFWVISIYLSLMRSFRSIAVLQYHKKCLNGIDCNKSAAMTPLLVQQRSELITAGKLCLDLVHAVNCLPKGYLWGGKLQKWQVGAIGTISSFIGLYMALRKKPN